MGRLGPAWREFTMLPRCRKRGKGAGAAVSYAPLRAAHEAGYQIGILQASSLCYGVYRRLGFEEICTFDLYVWAVGS